MQKRRGSAAFFIVVGSPARDLSAAEVKAVAEYFAGLGESKEAFDESQHRLR